MLKDISMLKLISYLTRRRHGADTDNEAARWCADPLSHPDIRRMDQRMLGDLPFDPARICDEAGGTRPRARSVAPCR